jgi:hypothetical protein
LNIAFFITLFLIFVIIIIIIIIVVILFLAVLIIVVIVVIIRFFILTISPIFIAMLSSASTLIEPLQDRRQTASALRLWQRANRLWCNTVTGGLDQLLGKWLVPGPQLRRIWPFYYDPDTSTLWSRTGEGFNVHSRIPFGCDRRTTHFHLQTN